MMSERVAAAPLAYDDYLAAPRFVGLDGVRAVAVAGSMLAHAPNAEQWGSFERQVGVYVFFVLSGFLITSLALREERVLGRLHLGAFMVRRAFRLFPLYYAVLGIHVVLLLGLGVGSPEKIENFRTYLAYYLFYFQEVPDIHTYYQTWSLGIEEKFYLVWPAVAFLIFRRSPGRWRWPAVFATIVALLWLISVFAPMASKPASYAAVLAGCASAIGADNRRLYAKMIPHLARWSPLLVVATVSMSLCRWQTLAPSVLTYLMIGLVIVALVSGCAPRLTSVLESPICRRIGNYSYCMYLVHLLAKNAVVLVVPKLGGEFAYSAAVYAGMFTLSFGIAAATYRFYERPMIHLGRRLSDRLIGDVSPPATHRRTPAA